MFPVKNTNPFLQVQHDHGLNGLNGWFGRMAKKLINLAINSIAGMAGPFSADVRNLLTTAMEDLTGNYTGGFWTRETEYNPTPAEETILTNWTIQKFNPYFKILAQKLSNAYADNNLTTKLAVINEVMQKICIIKTHFKTNDKIGLSALAVEFRNDFLNEVFNPFEVIIEEQLDSMDLIIQNVYVEMYTGFADFNPLILGSNTFDYNCRKYVLTGEQNTTFPANPVITNPVIIPVTPTNPTTPVVINPVNPKPTNPSIPVVPPKAEKNFMQKYGLSIGVGLVLLFWPEEKKKKKVNKNED